MKTQVGTKFWPFSRLPLWMRANMRIMGAAVGNMMATIITALIFAEKSLPVGRHVARAAALALVLYGAVVIFEPSALPMTMDSDAMQMTEGEGMGTMDEESIPGEGGMPMEDTSQMSGEEMPVDETGAMSDMGASQE